jgi:ubiquitin carboxyl-terminal hydrolase 7
MATKLFQRMQKSTTNVLLVLALLVEVHSSASSALSTDSCVSTGLQNLGNTCYLNSQLQCAYHIPKVRDLILTPLKSDSDVSNDREGNDSGSGESVPATMPFQESPSLQGTRLVFQDMLQASRKQTGPVAPRILCKVLGIPVYEQQDSQEFWKLLLPTFKLPELMDLYQGAFEDYIVALDGTGRERRLEEPFLDLSLDVTSGSVEESLRQLFGEPELLSTAEGNGWRPEKGAEKVDAHKGSLLRTQGLPSILQLHLKRFNYDWNTDTTSKLNDPFRFPLELNLSDVCKDGAYSERSQCVYDLQSVLIHMGEYSSGHYYVYVRPNVRKSEWCRFNDEVLTTGLTFEEVCADAYGGRTASKSITKRGPLTFLWRAFQSGERYGFGGRTSNAYVVQYVRRTDIPRLYNEG